ncbi:hypothetical protein AAZX31_10G252700 [Glycine max]|uniref:Uncharacterized protein n=1 Tax=Glycine max TaxID=3847 RepID=K7LLL5_SOYBN|nr:hypothetical protein JHK87_029226 [Glycine soja]KAG5128481.1 hypothetical protein JHK82_029316 [Glycine max]KRH35807.1 hypothetical protein GLYMA_10G266100v4 [Glycine max]
MACSLSSFCALNQAFCRDKRIKYPKIRSQSFNDDNGKRANIVDANLNILRERIQQVRKRERLIHTQEWNYKRSYDRKYKRDSMISQSSEVIGLSCGAIGLVFLVGSLSIFLLSLLVCM